MALSTIQTYYSNSIVGEMMCGADVGITQVHAYPKYPLGQGFTRADGNVFRYGQIGTATNAGVLVGPTVGDGATYNQVVPVASASAVIVQAEYPILPGQVGSHYIEATIASIGANKYQGGYLITTGGTGVGQTYRVIGNTPTGNPATGNIRLQLSEPLAVAILPSTGTIVVPSMFCDLVATAITSPAAIGVLMGTTTATNQWAWIQTHGPVGCQEDGTIALVQGMEVGSSRVTAGAYSATQITASPTTFVFNTVFASPSIGYCITPAAAGSASNRQGVIFLTLE